MGFVVLTAVGGILGWLASILSRHDDGRGIALNVVVGVIVALVAGGLASRESLMLGVSAQALLVAIVGASLVLAGFNAARVSRLR